MATVKPVRILILSGVRKHDLTVQPKPEPVHVQAEIYTRLPNIYTRDTWPDASNLQCWWCDRVADGYPRFIPQFATLTSGSVRCTPYGHFDRWSCAAAWIQTYFSNEEQWDAQEWLPIVEAEYSGARKLKIAPSPPRHLMKTYSGASGITEAEYAEMIRNTESLCISVSNSNSLRRLA